MIARCVLRFVLGMRREPVTPRPRRSSLLDPRGRGNQVDASCGGRIPPVVRSERLARLEDQCEPARESGSGRKPQQARGEHLQQWEGPRVKHRGEAL